MKNEAKDNILKSMGLVALTCLGIVVVLIGALWAVSEFSTPRGGIIDEDPLASASVAEQ